MTGEGALVGPNAAIQLAAALTEREGARVAQAVFDAAGRGDWVAAPPGRMIPEADAARLFSLTLAMLGPLRGRAALAEAGQRTGAYILAHRIPRAAQAVLRGLPARVAAPLMRRAIRRAAWTFAGSGRCLSDAGEGPAGLARFTLQANPLPLPGLPWHAAVFGTIFRALVDPRAETTVPCAGRAGCGGCDRQGCAVLVTRAARRRAGTPARRP